MTSDPSDADSSDSHSLPLPLAREIDRICDAFGAELRAGKEPRIEDFLDQVAASGHSNLLRELIVTELEFRISRGIRSDPDAWHARFPHDRPDSLTRPKYSSIRGSFPALNSAPNASQIRSISRASGRGSE